MIFYCAKCGGHLQKVDAYRAYECPDCKHIMFGLHSELDPLGGWFARNPFPVGATADMTDMYETWFIDDVNHGPSPGCPLDNGEFGLGGDWWRFPPH